MEAIQIAMQVSTIHQQQLQTIPILPSYNKTLPNSVNNENRQSTSNNFITTSNASQKEVETLTNLIKENKNQPSSDTQLLNTLNSATVNKEDLH